MSNGHPGVHRLLFTRCDSVGCIYNCFEYWRREEGVADRRAIAVARVEDQKPCLQSLCSGEAISRSSRVAVRRDGRAGGVTAAPSEQQIGQFPPQAPFLNISSSSKLSLSNDVTLPVQEACNFCENDPLKLGGRRLEKSGCRSQGLLRWPFFRSKSVSAAEKGSRDS